MMEDSWYIEEQCKRIHDNISFLEDIGGFQSSAVKEFLGNITIASLKIEAVAKGVDLSDLITQNKEKTSS